MMVLAYCNGRNLRNYSNIYISAGENYYRSKVLRDLMFIAMGLLNIHDAEKVHKDFHPGNVLLYEEIPVISDLGLCQPANNEEKVGIFGVLPYVAPEVLRGHQYTKASDMYSFGIIINELIS